MLRPILAALSTALLGLPALAETSGTLLGDQPLKVSIVEAPDPIFNNRVSLSPLSAIVGVGSLSYERAITPSFAASISPIFLYLGFGDDRMYGAGAGVGLAFYPSGEGLRGLRLAADFAPGFVSVESSGGASETVFVFQGKATLGYVWSWKNGFSLGLGGGVQYVRVKPSDTDSGFDGVLPALDATVGFAF